MKPDTSDFKTPEETAALDSLPSAEPIINKEGEELKMTKKKKFKLSKKQALIISGVVVVLLIVGSGAFLILKPKTSHVIQLQSSIPKVSKPTSNLVPSKLTGLMVSPSVNKLPITAIMIENSLAARPQSGLEQAGVVFEALAEGGITRFMALYQSATNPNYIGPIRSARPYFVQWALGFDADYVHVGGSPLALSDIQSWNVKDLNQFYYGSYFTRIPSRVPPHNVYSSMSRLNALENVKGYTSSNFTPWPRQKPMPLKTPTAANINLTLSNYDYNPSYVYNPKTNTYERSEAGSPQIGTDTNKQINPSVVIAMITPETNGPLDSSGAYYSVYSNIGSGQAYIFQNGGVQIGQWNKASNNGPLTFTDASGNPIPFNPGQVWITAVVANKYVNYTP
jgi:hypothetical protein